MMHFLVKLYFTLMFRDYSWQELNYFCYMKWYPGLKQCILFMLPVKQGDNYWSVAMTVLLCITHMHETKREGQFWYPTPSESQGHVQCQGQTYHRQYVFCEHSRFIISTLRTKWYVCLCTCNWRIDRFISKIIHHATDPSWIISFVVIYCNLYMYLLLKTGPVKTTFMKSDKVAPVNERYVFMEWCNDIKY